MHFGAFRCILVRLICNPMAPAWLALTPLPFQTSIYSRNRSHESLRTNFKLLCSAMQWCPFCAFWSILVHFGAPHVQPHDPSMTCSDSSTLPSVHLLQKWITLVIQDKYETLCSVMQWWPFWCFLVHFGAFWCASCVTPQPLHDLLWLLYPSKCPFIPEMDHMSHSG